MVLAKKGTTIFGGKTDEYDRIELGKHLEVLKACFKEPVLGYLWAIALYNPPRHVLSLSEIFETELKNVFIRGDFSASHHELQCTFNTENCEKTWKDWKRNFLIFQ